MADPIKYTILDQGDKLCRYSHVRLYARVNIEISGMVRPRSTHFGVKTSYFCMQIKFISNFGYYAPFADNVKIG